MATTCSDPEVLWGLFSAAYGGKLAKVKSLLKTNGLAADVSDPNSGSTVLQWASSGGSLEVVEWLVMGAGAKAAHRNKDDRTAFFFACEHCHKPVAEFLVGQTGVNVNDKDKPAGHSALHRACIAGQTRKTKASGAKVLISWLLSEGNADANAADISGRVPGEADLAAEAPKLKPTRQAAEIRKMLEDARTGCYAPGIATDTAPPAPAPAHVPEKPISKPEPGWKQEPKHAPAPRSEPASTRASAVSTSTDAATARRPMMTLAAARASATTTKNPAAALAAAGGDGVSTVTVAASDVSVAPRFHSPSRVAERAAALAAKTAPMSAAPVPTSSRTVPVPAEVAAVKPKATPSSVPAASIKGSASPGLKAPSSSSPPRNNAAEPTEPSSLPPWNVKLRPGGVQPRSGGGSPTAASSVPTERGEVAARPAPTEATAAEKTAPVSKHYGYGQKNSTPAAGGNGVVSSSAPAARFSRPSISDSPPEAGSVTGASAAAVIEASNAPKASALAAAFENKARGRRASPPPVRRGHSGQTSTAKAPALSGGVVPGRSNGGGKLGASRSAAQSVPPAEKVTPQELLGSGYVMQKTKMYVAAAKGAQGSADSRDDAAPFLAKGKKSKDGSFMDKIVSIFTVSPESSPSSSPARSVRSATRSPKSKPRNPMAANGGAANLTAASSPYGNARLGFFHTNNSFQMEVGEKE